MTSSAQASRTSRCVRACVVWGLLMSGVDLPLYMVVSIGRFGLLLAADAKEFCVRRPSNALQAHHTNAGTELPMEVAVLQAALQQ